LGDNRRPAGGVSDGATAIGASELVDWPDRLLEALAAWEAVLSVLARAASCEGCGALPAAGDAATAEPGSAPVSAQARQQARMAGGRDTTRA
jgi:hypothetical protein